MSEKTLDVSSVEDLKQKVSDVQVVGNGNLFQLLSKASSKDQGWMKSTKAMEILNEDGNPLHVVVQVTTQQKNADGTYSLAEAITYVPNARIAKDDSGNNYLQTSGPLAPVKNK